MQDYSWGDGGSLKAALVHLTMVGVGLLGNGGGGVHEGFFPGAS